MFDGLILSFRSFEKINQEKAFVPIYLHHYNGMAMIVTLEIWRTEKWYVFVIF